MLIAALSHLYAFPYKEYAGAKYWRFSWFPWKPCPCDKIEWLLPWHGSPGESCIMCQFLTENYCFGHESCADDDGDCRVLFLQFAPTYHDYVLYNHNEGDEGRRKFRSRTFVPTDPEMDAVRKNKHMLGNKLDDIQLSSVSSSGTSNPKQSSTAQDSQNPETCLPCYPPILTTCRTTCLSSTLTCPATLQRFLQQMQALSPSIVQSIRVFLQMGKWDSLTPQHKWKKREKVVSCCVGICTVSHSLKITLSNMEIRVCNWKIRFYW